MFSLRKWYFDVTTAEGDVAIAYCADVRWGSLRQPFSGVLVAPAGTGPRPWRFSARAVETPAFAEGDDGAPEEQLFTGTDACFDGQVLATTNATTLLWRSEPLALSVEYASTAPAFERRLFDGGDGTIDWRCLVSHGDARIVAGDVALVGRGYVERLEMSLLPWRIPADEIRWGRLIAGDTSVVWIDWRGDRPLSLVFHDGRAMPVASISDEMIRFGDGCSLRLDVERVVSDDMLGGLLSPLEALRPLVAPVMRTRQTRWLSRGELHGVGPVPLSGWAVHELVRRR